MEKKIVIRRPIGGISLNGYEYVTEDEAGENIIFFGNEEKARQYLINAGYTPEELQEDLDECAIDICEWNKCKDCIHFHGETMADVGACNCCENFEFFKSIGGERK